MCFSWFLCKPAIFWFMKCFLALRWTVYPEKKILVLLSFLNFQIKQCSKIKHIINSSSRSLTKHKTVKKWKEKWKDARLNLHVFMWHISQEILKVFNALILKQIFWKTKTFYKKLDYCCLVESTINWKNNISIQNFPVRNQC